MLGDPDIASGWEFVSRKTKEVIRELDLSVLPLSLWVGGTERATE